MSTIVSMPECEWCGTKTEEVWKCRICGKYSCSKCLRFVDSSDRCVHKDSSVDLADEGSWDNQSELDKFCEENLLDRWQGYS